VALPDLRAAEFLRVGRSGEARALSPALPAGRRLAAAAAGALALAALAAAAGPPEPTYADGVGRLLRESCGECHRAGGTAPFSVFDPGEAAAWAPSIAEETEQGHMPPWKPVSGWGRFHGENRLDAADLDLLRRWSEAGAPRGTGPVPPDPGPPPDWALGEPDAVLAPAAPYAVPASATDSYRCFPLATAFAEDRWVRALDIRPGDRSLVHHVIVYLDDAGASHAVDAADPGEGYACFGGAGVEVSGALGGWAPGFGAMKFGANAGIRLPAGATLVLQVHYAPTETPSEDRTAVGLYFHDATPRDPMFLVPVGSDAFTIPAGAAAHEIVTEYTLPALLGVRVHAVAPHMHLLGRSMRVDADLPDGTGWGLVRIDDWDFHWQAPYRYRDPVPLPGGTVVTVRAVYDNSAANPRNPSSPPVPVSYGESTTDEMGWAFLAASLGMRGGVPPAPGVLGASVDANGRLAVRARRAARGACIEADGVVLRDTRGRRTLRSAAFEGALGGVPAVVRVRHPDGRLSAPFEVEAE
jgi:mono/diheme cytochrome c family protein